MLVEQIEYFLRQRLPNRMNPFSGRAHPLHPVVIVGFDPSKVIDPKEEPPTPLPTDGSSKERRSIKAA